MSIDPESFIRIWQSSSSIKEVAKKAGLTPVGAAARAASYRRKDIPLKSMPGNKRGRPPLDRKALARLAKECAK